VLYNQASKEREGDSLHRSHIQVRHCWVTSRILPSRTWSLCILENQDYHHGRMESADLSSSASFPRCSRLRSLRSRNCPLHSCNTLLRNSVAASRSRATILWHVVGRSLLIQRTMICYELLRELVCVDCQDTNNASIRALIRERPY
jgi:hypothetical protein